MDAPMAVNGDLVLHIAPEKFYVEPLDNPKELLVIDRVNQEIHLEANHGQIPPESTRQAICGLMGILRLLAGPYLVVITKKEKVGDIHGQAIWKVKEVQLMSYPRTLLHLTERQIHYNKAYLNMAESVLQTESYYFSTTYDLTHSLQRLHNTTPDFLLMPLHERADQRFVWNCHLLREFAQQPELARYCLPVLHGFISIRLCTINHKTFTWTLISRRSCFRAGTRFNVRGLDSEGHAANFVETEQIVEHNGNRCSFVQTRGSIPLFWTQKANLRYMPAPQITPGQTHTDGFSRHFDNQVFNYGKQVIINLINHKGRELKLEQALANLVQKVKNPHVQYVSFDFHHECRHMRWDRLSKLMDRVAETQEEFGYFLMLSDGSVPIQQEGVFRTNCMDCLDRTNVVQSMLARKSLESQLKRLGILMDNERIEDQTIFEAIYKNVWGDNADVCAVQYAGTGALKTDFTRTGKRTQMGAMKDGVNALHRYFKNNFSDGYRQDSIDLVLGNYVVEETEGVTATCPLYEQKDWKYIVLPIISLIALSLCFIHLLLPPEYTVETLLYFLFWLGMFLASVSFIFLYGSEFVDAPRLTESRRKKD